MSIPDMGFDADGLHARLEALDEAALDQLGFGVIGFDADGVIRRYNAWESRATGLDPARVLGQPLFTVVAQCMNNYLVAQRFEDTVQGDTPLDVVMDYVLTWKVRPVPVQLRLLAPVGAPGPACRYVVIRRLA
ncbi:PAS domain-containing protein [Sphaerotilus mobilis]|nr:PAS domain-containing protein [Sphaerotilus mobilis]